MNPLAYFANNFKFYFYFCANFPKSRVYVAQAAHDGKAEKKNHLRKLSVFGWHSGRNEHSESVDDTAHDA